MIDIKLLYANKKLVEESIKHRGLNLDLNIILMLINLQVNILMEEDMLMQLEECPGKV